MLTHSRTDFDRLSEGELLYLGGERTPICSLVSELPWRGRLIPIMREFFADIGDCAVCLGLGTYLDSDEATNALSSTADGKPRTLAHALARLARMMGRDSSQLDESEAKTIAMYVIQRARRLVLNAVDRLDPSGKMPLVAVGHHQWLLSDELQKRCVSLDECSDSDISRVGPAFALCRLHSVHPGNRFTLRIGNERLTMTGCKQVVVKLGGSLLLQPNLGARLVTFLERHYPETQIYMIVGGGRVIDALRELDQIHACDATDMHWLCVRALRTTFDLVSMLLPHARRIDSFDAFNRLSDQREPGLYLIAVDTFYTERDHEVLPCDWRSTSDSIAALLAQRLGIPSLCLVKSCEVPARLSQQQAVAMGVVDPAFDAIAANLQVTFASLPSDRESHVIQR